MIKPPLASALFLSALTVAPGALAYSEPIAPPRQLCIYYGWPSYVNGANGDSARAAVEFSKCALLVLGDGLELASHPDHSATVSIVANVTGAGREVFGYIDLGVTTQNLTLATMQQYVDLWKAMGASGIFLDDAGYDYGVTRARQNAIVDYAHAHGLKVFMNAWVIDDALGGLDEAGNPNPSRLVAGDWYLAESWLVAAGAYQPLADWAIKADKAQQYQRSKGIRIAAVGTNPVNKATAADAQGNKFNMSRWGAAMYQLDAWQWTDAGYSSGNAVVNFYPPLPTYGTSFTSATVSHQNRNRTHSRTTDTGTIVVDGNGSSKGTRSFVAR